MNLDSGIYRIVNTKNGKCYVGSALSGNKRREEHKNDLKSNRHHNRYLQNAWNKHGEECFKFEVLLYCDRENLLFYEQRAIDVYQSADGRGYNLSPTAGSTLGMEFTEEAKKKISESLMGNIPWNKGKPWSDEMKLKLSKAHKGQVSWSKGKTGVYSKDTIKKMSEARKGVVPWNKGKTGVYSEGTRRKMSEACIGRPSPNKGKSPSEEARQKMREAKENYIPWNKGKKTGTLSEEHRRKIGLGGIGRKHSEETKQKMSKAHKGKIFSREHRQKLSEAKRKGNMNASAL